MLDEFLLTQESVSKRGNPETYPDASLIVFSAVMTLKGITAMRAQQDYLFHHPLWLQRCRLPACPSQVTLGRRYKALTPIYSDTNRDMPKGTKTAIEPIFDLLSKLLSITGKHKPLPVRNLAYVSTFLGKVIPPQ